MKMWPNIDYQPVLNGYLGPANITNMEIMFTMMYESYTMCLMYALAASLLTDYSLIIFCLILYYNRYDNKFMI